MGECLRVGIAQTSSPALHGDDNVALVEQTKFYGLVNSPPQTFVNIVLPYSLVEIGLSFRVNKGIYTTVQVRVSSSVVIAGDLWFIVSKTQKKTSFGEEILP